MNRNLHLPVKLASLLILIALLVMPGVGWGQTPIFTESIGTVSATTTIAAHEAANGFDNDDFTMSGTADVRSTGASTGYTGASGNANIFFTNTAGRYFLIEGINTENYSSIALTLGHFKSTTTGNNELTIEVSSNGIDWTPLTYSRPTGTGTANWVLISPTGAIPSTSNLRLRFTNSSATIQFRLDDIILTGTTSGNPTAATPTFSPVAGTFYSAQNVTLASTTENSTIYYTTDGSDPDDTDTEYTAAIPVSSTTTIKAIAYATGFDPSAIATAVYTFPTITEVANIAALRAVTLPSTEVYKLTGEAIVTFAQTFRNQKWIQDETAAILIDDVSGLITGTYTIDDGITNVLGTLSEFGGMLQFIPVANASALAVPTITVVPTVLTMTQFLNDFEDYESQLVTIEAVDFTSADGIVTFANGSVYEISDGTDAGSFRATFFDVNYIGQVIPELTQNVTGILNERTSAPIGKFISARNLADFENTSQITFFFRGPSWMNNNPHNPQIWGPFNGWSTPPAMVLDVVTGWWSVTVEVADPTASIEYQSRFSQDGTTKFQKAFENFGANAAFTTTTGEIWIDASNNSSFTWQGDDFYLAEEKITESEPVPFVPQIDWCNLQSPATGIITAGGDYDVYARVYMSFVTEPAGQGANISAWIGYSTTNTNPNTWSNWVAATFNGDVGNNDEYMANIGATLSPGTYYYASRFQHSTLDFVYGGYSDAGGSFWNGVDFVSGVLTVNAPPVVVPDVIISEVYGGGGNSGATYTHDFIELYNTTASPVDISGWSVQYYGATTTGLSTNVFVIPSGKSIPAYAHFLIQAAQGSGGSVALPTPDAISTIAMGAAAGKVILYTTSEAQTISDLTSITGNPNFKDYVPYGTTAIPVWGSATVAVTNTTSASRIAGSEAYAYTQNIGNDFEVIAPNPRNSQQSYRSIADGLWADLATWETFFRGTDWIDAVALPLATDDVLVNHTINISSFANCKNLVIGTGSLSVANGGSFIPTGTVTGDVTVIRNIAGLNQYHFISSPISNAALGNVFPAGDELNIYLREYDEAAGNWANLTIPATLENGKGYSFFMDIASTTATFTGTLNNADLMPMMTNSGTSGNTNYDGWNLLGNPFASAIQWGLGSWALNNVNNEVHVWSNGVYLSYAGGAGSLTDGIIPAQQGFFVKANNTEPSLTIPTASRLHSSQGFYKNSIADLLRLDVSDNSTYTDATFVRFSFDATEEFDAAYDAHKLDNDEAAPMLYTMHNETRFSINTLRSISETPEVPVYFKAGADGEYTINASGMESFENRIIYLTDLLTGLRQDLRQNPVYAFNASVGDDANRFKLSFATLGIGEKPGLNIGVYAVDGQIRLLLPEAMKGTVNITNLSGQALYSRNFSASGELGINASFPAGVYLVSVVTAQGTATRKVFVN
jgi:hypothetical protein